MHTAEREKKKESSIFRSLSDLVCFLFGCFFLFKKIFSCFYWLDHQKCGDIIYQGSGRVRMGTLLNDRDSWKASSADNTAKQRPWHKTHSTDVPY